MFQVTYCVARATVEMITAARGLHMIQILKEDSVYLEAAPFF